MPVVRYYKVIGLPGIKVVTDGAILKSVSVTCADCCPKVVLLPPAPPQIVWTKCSTSVQTTGQSSIYFLLTFLVSHVVESHIKLGVFIIRSIGRPTAARKRALIRTILLLPARMNLAHSSNVAFKRNRGEFQRTSDRHLSLSPKYLLSQYPWAGGHNGSIGSIASALS